jgi:Tfp pilus assembly protein FimT
MTSERGIGFFGLLIVLAIAAAVAYFAYKGITGADAPQTCASAFASCMQKCRRTSTEAPAAQACQEACQRDMDACQRK